MKKELQAMNMSIGIMINRLLIILIAIVFVGCETLAAASRKLTYYDVSSSLPRYCVGNSNLQKQNLIELPKN